MSFVSEKLQVLCPTFNRAENLRCTLSQLLDDSSPVRECELIVFDNCSNDSTAAVIEEFSRRFRNVSGVRNRYNVGGNANIVKCMERADKEYVWIVGDDDFYDFSHWSDVELAMHDGEGVICIADYLLDGEKRSLLPWQMVQSTFITGCILKCQLYNDTVLAESYNHIHCLFPHMIPIVHHINGGGRIFVSQFPIVSNGDDGSSNKKDVSYTRGSDRCNISPYTIRQTWLSGWCRLCASVQDSALRHECFIAGLGFIDKGKTVVPKIDGFYAAEILRVAPLNMRKKLKKRFVMKKSWFTLMRYRLCAYLLFWRREIYLKKIKWAKKAWYV